jgi:hypothetical protein
VGLDALPRGDAADLLCPFPLLGGEVFPEFALFCLFHLVLLAFRLIIVLILFMGAVKNIVPAKKRGRGRPRKDDPIRTVVRVALSASGAERFAEWMEKNGISSQSEAGRVLIEQALAAAEKRGRTK